MNSLVTAVLDRLVREIEAGKNPWKKSWKGSSHGLPSNATTKKSYRGINTLLLWLAQSDHGYTSSRWATYKQWSGAGHQVKKGEKGTPIVFWKILERGEGEEKRNVPLLRVSWVFNETQLTGEEEVIALPVLTPDERHAKAQAWFDQSGIRLGTSIGNPCYSPMLDVICMPPAASFTSLDEYWATMFHEGVHWTGHKSRLARNMVPFAKQSQDYAREELVAEIGAAFMNAEFGIDTEQNNAAYLKGWLSVLPDKHEAIFMAAKHASAAFDYLTKQDAMMEQAA